MAFTRIGSTVDQTVNTDDQNLSGLVGLTGVTVTHDGIRAVYTLDQDVGLRVNGTLFIDPTREVLVTDVNGTADIDTSIEVTSTGTLSFGRTALRNGRESLTEGVAWINQTAPRIWHGSSGTAVNLQVLSGGTLVIAGATLQGPTSFACQSGSTLVIQQGRMVVENVAAGENDPRTGATAAANTGTFRRTGSIPTAGRGFISWIRTSDYHIDGFEFNGPSQLGGGELLINEAPTGQNSHDTTLPNQFEGYSAQYANYAAFPNRVSALTLRDSDLSGGNRLDVSIQTEGLASGTFTNTTLVNERSGTALTILGGEVGRDLRNQGSVHIFREVNLRATSLTTGMPIEDGGRYYINDTDNGFRSSAAGIDDTDSIIYSNTFANGTAANPIVLLGAVKTQSNEYDIGTHRISQGSRNTGTTNLPSSTNPYSIDLRGKVNTQGSDLFDIYVWHELYQPSPLLDSDLSEGTTGLRQFNLAMADDANYQVADFAAPGEIRTLDELYKAEKLRKIATASDMEQPSLSSIYTVGSDRNIDLGAVPLVVSTTAPERYEAVHSSMTSGAIMTASFNTGAVTRVGGSNATLSNQGSFGSPLGDGEVGLATGFATLSAAPFVWNSGSDWRAIQGIYLDVDSPGASGIANTTQQVLVYVDNNNYAIYNVQGGGTSGNGTQISRELVSVALDSAGDQIRAGSPPGDNVEVTVIYGPLASLYQEGMTLPANITISSTSLTTGPIFEGVVTTGTVDNGGMAADYNIDASDIMGLPTAGEIVTSNGGLSGGVALAAGSYIVNGDASGARFTRSGNTGTVSLTFGPDSTRPTAPLGANVESPFTLTIDGRLDPGGLLSVYRNGVVDTTLTIDNDGNTIVEGVEAGTDEFVVVYTAPGRTDYRFPETGSHTLSANESITVVSEANLFPERPSGTPMNDIVGSNVVTFTASTTPGRGVITILDDSVWSTGAAITNYGIQHLVKGKEVYNNIIRVSNVLNGVTSLGVNSSAQVDGRVITFESSSPRTIGFVRALDADNPIRTLTSGRFFSATTTTRVSANYVYNTAHIAAGDPGEFSILTGNQFIDIHDVDGDTTNRTAALAGVMPGDLITITDNSNPMMPVEILQAVVTDNVDQTSFRRFNVADTIPTEVAAMLTGGNTYQISITDAAGSTIRVGVSFGQLDAFDPGITASQIELAVGRSSDVANSLRFVRQGRNSVLPVQQAYDPDVEY